MSSDVWVVLYEVQYDYEGSEVATHVAFTSPVDAMIWADTEWEPTRRDDEWAWYGDDKEFMRVVDRSSCGSHYVYVRQIPVFDGWFDHDEDVLHPELLALISADS